MAPLKPRQTTVWITGDQCSFRNTALLRAGQQNTRVLMIESISRGNKLKYHKKKLILIYSIMRHFAQELREAGWDVDYYEEYPDFQDALDRHIKDFKPGKFIFMEQSEYGADEKMTQMIGDLPVEITPHCNFISTAEEFEQLHTSASGRVTMERFYHEMRKKTGLLLEDGRPTGGSWNLDKQNRNPPDKNFKANPLLEFPPDTITSAVIAMVEKHFSDHPGTTDGWIYAVTRRDALRAAEDFFENKLADFGKYQDAMLYGQPFLNHSVLSPYVNTCLLHPLELAREAEERYISRQVPLSSAEGFIRQLIGWREFVWRVYWRMMPDYKDSNKLQAHRHLPEFYWTGDTPMRCMSDCVKSVNDHGYAHHIARLMILGNFALIAGLDPLETNDWFHSMFVDGYDWVMVPNVIGMTLHADGGYVGTKPYAASANYINKMSDYCKGCSYDQTATFGPNACPFNSLYWDFMLRHQKYFSNNQRLGMIMKGLVTKDDEWKAKIKSQADFVVRHLH